MFGGVVVSQALRCLAVELKMTAFWHVSGAKQSPWTCNIFFRVSEDPEWEKDVGEDCHGCDCDSAGGRVAQSACPVHNYREPPSNGYRI